MRCQNTMRLSKLLFVTFFAVTFVHLASADTANFESNWCFLKGDVTGAEKPGFDDSGWRKLDVPHDWSIEGPFDRDNPTGRGGAYLPAGIGWYRKSFTLDADAKDKRIFIDFDGVMANSDVWINGMHLGKRPNGYVSFRYELTGHLNFGKGVTNVLAVRADNSIQPASRWYTGSGIYRHVYLTIENPVHIGHWGVFVTTPQVTDNEATVRVATSIFNQSDAAQTVTLKTTIVDDAGADVATSETPVQIEAGKTEQVSQDLEITHPKRWDIDDPTLYTVDSTVLDGQTLLDAEKTPLGIREFEFKADTGFWLNGRNVKIKGVCLHHDCGGLGSAVPKRAWERRLARLKAVGVNAIRTAHNPVNPELLDLCDEMGFVVLHEVLDTWTAAKNHAEKGYNLHFKKWGLIDSRDTVLRDRNHPSIVIYSTGNEIRDNLRSKTGVDQFLALRDLYHELDPTRPVTQAIFRPNQNGIYDNGFAELMDVVGQNYRPNEIVAAHRDKPSRKILSTENGHSRRSWLLLRDNPFYAGQFLWTGIDYLGEANWPYICWGESLFDRTCTPRPRAFQRQSWWSEKPMVHIARRETDAGGGGDSSGRYELCSNWTPRDFDTYDEATIEVYSDCDEVEVFLNGQSQGAKPKPADDSPRVWRMYFDPGTIKAVGKNNGQVVATHELKSAGQPASIKLSADRQTFTHDWDDVVYVTVDVLDAKGIECPWAENLMNFEISGPGVIAAVDNGNRISHESFQRPQRRAYHGKCFAVIRATEDGGTITLKASSDGLKSDSISIDVGPTKK